MKPLMSNGVAVAANNKPAAELIDHHLGDVYDAVAVLTALGTLGKAAQEVGGGYAVDPDVMQRLASTASTILLEMAEQLYRVRDALRGESPS